MTTQSGEEHLFPKHNNKYKSYNNTYISVVHTIILLIGVSMPSWVKWCILYSIFYIEDYRLKQDVIVGYTSSNLQEYMTNVSAISELSESDAGYS